MDTKKETTDMPKQILATTKLVSINAVYCLAVLTMLVCLDLWFSMVDGFFAGLIAGLTGSA